MYHNLHRARIVPLGSRVRAYLKKNFFLNFKYNPGKRSKRDKGNVGRGIRENTYWSFEDREGEQRVLRI